METRTVQLFEQPISILDNLSENKSMMTKFEQGFICGLIKEYRPKKILEVGVAAGGTTAVILNCVTELQLDCKVFSVDILKQYHLNRIKKVGYLIDDLRDEQIEIDFEKHRFFLGDIFPNFAEEIGGEIDFLVLDTAHVLPGEVLDFISIFPYLAKDAIVVLHDIVLQYRYSANHKKHFATSILFQSVVADKFLNNEEKYPNIAAFRLNEDTPKYILNLFLALMVPWVYIPNEHQLEAFEKLIEQHYSAECLKIFRQALSEAEFFLKYWREQNEKERAQQEREQFSDKFRSYEMAIKLFLSDSSKKLMLYGAGKRGKAFLDLMKKFGLPVHGFLVSDAQTSTSFVQGLPVYTYSDQPFSKEELLIIQTAKSEEIEETLKQSQYQWLILEEGLWHPIEEMCYI